jgi:hypothetical protein
MTTAINSTAAAVTSVTIASSISLRLRVLAQRISDLGARPLHEAMCEVVGGADPMTTFERHAALNVHIDLIRAYGGTELPPNIWVVK